MSIDTLTRLPVIFGLSAILAAAAVPALSSDGGGNASNEPARLTVWGGPSATPDRAPDVAEQEAIRRGIRVVYPAPALRR